MKAAGRHAGLNVRGRARARLVMGLAGLGMALCAALPSSALAQAWPSRPVRIIVPFPAGGSTMEQVVRLLTQDMQKTLGQPIVIESKPGAGTVIGVDAAAKSVDGHTFVGVANSFTVNQTLMKNLPYDGIKDLKPVVLMARTANVFAARPGIPVSSLKELVAYAKANPGKLSYASFGNGTTAHFAGEMFKTMAGIDMVHVPYKGQGPALTDLLGGQVDLMFGNLPDFLPHVRSGKLKALGTTFLTRVPQAPEIPTIAEQGYPKFETDSWYGLLAPAALPREVVARMNAEFNKVLADPAIRKGMEERGLEPLGGTVDRFGTHITSEIARYEQVVKTSNMKID